jgi:hypothetical protein
MNGETVTWHRRVDTGKLDRYRKPILVDADTDIDDVLVAPSFGNETAGTADDTSSTQITLYFTSPLGTSADDEFTVRGVRYKAVGPEADWSTGFTDWNPGSALQLDRREYVGG